MLLRGLGGRFWNEGGGALFEIEIEIETRVLEVRKGMVRKWLLWIAGQDLTLLGYLILYQTPTSRGISRGYSREKQSSL